MLHKDSTTLSGTHLIDRGRRLTASGTTARFALEDTPDSIDTPQNAVSIITATPPRSKCTISDEHRYTMPRGAVTRNSWSRGAPT